VVKSDKFWSRLSRNWVVVWKWVAESDEGTMEEGIKPVSKSEMTRNGAP